MNTTKIDLRLIAVTSFILLAALSRLIPHLPNFSPLGAIALFGAAYFTKKWQAFLIPIAATWISDLLINNILYSQYFPEFTWFYSGFYWQYGTYLVIVLAGLFIFKKVNTPRIAGGILASTALFFLISNFGVWLGSPTYPQNFGGLMACYAAGIPFIKGTLMGDLFYSALLFGSFAFAQSRIPALRLAK